MEKSWEHMMGSDWREFRANLVAQEKTAMVADGKKSSKQASSSSSKKEEKIGNFISGAISSIFSKGDSSKEKEREETASTTAVKEDYKNSPVDIFDGVDVGGATKFSKIQMSSPCDDPFMDEEECHIVYDEPRVKIDSHRWAHPLFHVEPGCILIANEKLGGVFHQTVVLIIDHNENTGSTGMVINR
jgi:putative transcriptional regulator